MPKAWDIQPGEPALWYSRFHSYLLLGPERSLEDAYRKFREAQAGVEPASRRPPCRVPGSWSEVSRKWRWAERARDWDADERARLRRAHYAKLKAMNERHQEAAKAVFSRSIKAIVAASSEGLSLPQAIACFDRAVSIERRVMGEPLGVELVVRGERPEDLDFDDATREASAVSIDRFAATPEIYEAVARVMAQHETKPFPGEPAADIPPTSPALADEPEDVGPALAADPAADLEARPSAQHPTPAAPADEPGDSPGSGDTPNV